MKRTVLLNLIIVALVTKPNAVSLTVAKSDKAAQRAEAVTAVVSAYQSADTDGDGLSDFHEIHKYLTNPDDPDSDGDDVGDGDWDERREYAYWVRSVLRFMYPFDEDGLNDNFQDARVLKKESTYVEVEVIHYPFGTAEQSILANPNWQQDYAHMTEYLEPGITTNWDAGMREDLLAELRADGIVIDDLTDKEVVQKVSSWVIGNYREFTDIFTTYYVYYPNGRPEIYPGLEDAFERDSGPYGWTTEQQFEHELLGRGMYYNKTRGTCTSTAVALTTALRAVGIPTRMIIVVPVVDLSDPSQLQLVREQIGNDQVRQVMLDGLTRSGAGFTAHTYNEVYVGNQWHRLNYSKLGQGILDKYLFGLSTHLYTFHDLSDANLAPTWGYRYGKGLRDDVFRYNNPYTATALSDRLGKPVEEPNGAMLYVDDDASGDPGPYNPWVSDPCEDGSILHPYDSIQEAIDVAMDGNTVVVLEGTYTGPGNRDIDFGGRAITVGSTYPNDPDVVAATIIDCQASASDPHRGFYFHSYEGADSVLDGLTITNGYASGNWPQDNGGAVLCLNAGPTIKNCLIVTNAAQLRGGGVYSYQSSVTLINCMFRANHTPGYGGAVYNHTSNLLLADCTFKDNSADQYGGGMCNVGNSNNITLTNCVFTANSAGSNGGGIYHEYSSNLRLTNCTFNANTATYGGGMYIYSSNPELTNCILWGDSPEEIYARYSAPIATYSNVHGGFAGIGNMNVDPLFADAANGDCHLKSQAGRWDPVNQTWVQDEVTSLCIDAGRFDADWTAELWPHGRHINMGAFGGTPQASMSESSVGNPADFNNDDTVDWKDLLMLADMWLAQKRLCAEDISRNGLVNFSDFGQFALSWLCWQ